MNNKKIIALALSIFLAISSVGIASAEPDDALTVSVTEETQPAADAEVPGEEAEENMEEAEAPEEEAASGEEEELLSENGYRLLYQPGQDKTETFGANVSTSVIESDNEDYGGYEYFMDVKNLKLYKNKENGKVLFVNGTKVLFAQPIQYDDSGAKINPDEVPTDYNTYYTAEYTCPEEYISRTMKFFYEKGDYVIFVDDKTGAAAFLRKSTGDFLLTNPYDLGSKNVSETEKKTKSRLLSQFVFTYTKSNTATEYSTFEQAAMNGQVAVKNIRGGVRVEYTVGRMEARFLVPMMIEKDRFEREILGKITMENAAPGATAASVEKDRKYLLAFYGNGKAKDIKTAATTKERNSLLLQYPIAKQYAFYMCDATIALREKYKIESIIKQYTTYTYEDLQADHAMLEYDGTSASPPLFKMAIEYYIDDNGLKVRVPAKGINYDRNTYKITELRILPYLGAGSQDETGYTFYPDGSGVIVRFEDIGKTTKTISGKIYGQDYAYHAASGQNKEVMRFPAFGVMRNKDYVIAETKITKSYMEEIPIPGTEDEYTYKTTDGIVSYKGTEVKEPTAYVAFMEEGESLSQITTDHGGTTHKYNSTYATVYPQVTDTYALTGISTSGDATWSVNINRGYTGNYTFRIFMLSGEDANYTGMAKAVREYLISTGKLSEKKPEGDGIPLVLENFGSIKTNQKFLGMPVTENTQLTTFDQSISMIEDLKANGVGNIKLKLTGWYNGGMEHTAPSKLKVQKAIGGEKGLSELAEYAKQNGVELYPDLEFTYVTKDASFDGFTYKDDAVRTVDNKAASHRVYSALYQGFEDDKTLIVNASRMLDLYENVSKKYTGFGIGGISVASLGSDLSSDNHEDYEITREEAKQAITSLLGTIKEENGKVLLSGGNAYAIGYADVLTDVPLDSSRNVYASETVPFIGTVLHGCVDYTGTAINLDGDYGYSVLKCIENGANPYFILSYTDEDTDNTSELKSFTQFSKYYSIKYNIWKELLGTTYNQLNKALGDIRDYEITDHEYIADRVVRVEYYKDGDGKTFILNYNNEDYDYNGTTVGALSFAVVANG